MREFSLLEALNGVPVVTRKGEAVEGFGSGAYTYEYPYQGYLGKDLLTFTCEGKYRETGESDKDLFMKSPKIVYSKDLAQGQIGKVTEQAFKESLLMRIFSPREGDVRLVDLLTGETWANAPAFMVEILPEGVKLTVGREGGLHDNHYS